MSHMWDLEDPRLLVCEAKSLLGTTKQRDHYLTTSTKDDRVSKFKMYIICISLNVVRSFAEH